jgi:hypothetical protein
MREARGVTEVPRRLRWLMNTFAIGVLLWSAYCVYAWATNSGVWRVVMAVIREWQSAAPSERSVALIAWGFGIGAMLAIAWPVSLVFRRRC